MGVSFQGRRYMTDIFGQFPEILRYGAAGISAVVCFFAYLLLKQQIGKGRTNKSLLRAIVIFIGLSVIILSLVDVGLQDKLRSGAHLLRTQQAKMNIIASVTGDTSGMPMPSAGIRVLPSTGDDFVVKTDDQGNFVFKGVPEKMRWMIAKRDFKPEAKTSGRSLLDWDKKDDTVPSSPL